MKRYKDLNEFIQDHPDTFDNHVAERISLPTGKNDCYIKFAQPDTRCGFMEFIYVGGYLTIQGDYGNASFTWHNPNNTIEKLADFAHNLGYFMSKCESAERSSIPHRYLKCFDSDICIKEVKELFEGDGKKIDLEKFENWESYTEDHYQWVAFIREDGADFFQDPDYWEYAGDLGECLEYRAYLYPYGLIKAIEYLSNQITYCPMCKESYQQDEFNSTCEKCGFVGAKREDKKDKSEYREQSLIYK